MSGIDYVVPARSWDQIATLTQSIREQFGLVHEPWFPIINFIEQVLDYRLNWVILEVRTSADMDCAEGLTATDGSRIILRDDVYAAAWHGNGRARFTASHELGHLFMHTNLPMARAVADVKPFRRSEAQADQFAAELLMPRDFFIDGDDVATVVRRHGVSQAAAQARLAYLRKKGLIS